MGRRAKLVNAVSKGVLDLELAERIDLAHYHSGLRVGRNIETLPQSGFRRRAGTRRLLPLRNRLEPVPVTEGQITLHNGGTKSALIDQDATTLFTTANVSATPYVVFEVALSAPMPISAVDVERYSCERNSADDALAVEYWTGSTWLEIGPAGADDLGTRRDISTTARTRRFASSPSQPIWASALRVMIRAGAGTSPDGIGGINVGGIRIWRERADRPVFVRLVEFARDQDASYVAALGDRNIDFFDEGVFIGSVPLAMPSHRIRQCRWQQSLDTMFVYHEDLETPRITRQGARDEWNAAAVAWSNVPTLKPAQTFSGNSDEVQDIVTTMTAGAKCVAFLGNLVTGEITYTTSGQFAVDLAAALAALPGVSDGVSPADVTVTLQSLSPQRFRVTFQNFAGRRHWPLIDILVLEPSTATATVTRVRRGIDASGPLVGARTGWPRCGTLHQARHWVGGFASAPQTIAATVIGDYENLNRPASAQADHAIVMTLDTNQIETVRDIFAGRHLQVFTERGEWWSDNRAFDATQPVNMILATRNGSSAEIPPVFADGSTVYVQDGGSVVRDMQFVDTSQNYEAGILNLLSARLARDITGIAYRPGRTGSEPGQLFAARADGAVAYLALNRGQEVVAWSEHVYADPVRGALSTSRGDTYFVAERSGRLWLLARDPDLILDGVVEYTGVTGTLVDGLGYHEGRDVWVVGDGEVYGPLPVSGGVLTMPRVASHVVVGTDIEVDAEPMPIRAKLSEDLPFRPPARIYAADVSVVGSGVFEFATNTDAFEEIDARYYDLGPIEEEATGEETIVAPDAPMMDRLVTGVVKIEGCEGFSDHPRWRLRQRKPAPLMVRAVRLEIVQRS